MLISIITINYNNVTGLQKTINSVILQKNSLFEFIIIDGGSTDNSLSVLKENEKYIDYWVSEPDSGIFNAMNKGIKQTQGEYLLFLNSGDVLNGENALLDFTEHNNFNGDIIYGDYIFEKGEKIYPDLLTPLFFIKSSLPHQSTLFKRSVFDVMGGYDESFRIAGDRAFYVACFLKSNLKFIHINYPLALYDITGLSNNKEYKQIKEKEDEIIFQKYYGLYYKDYKRILKLEQTINKLKRNTISGYFKRVIKRIKKAIITDART